MRALFGSVVARKRIPSASLLGPGRRRLLGAGLTLCALALVPVCATATPAAGGPGPLAERVELLEQQVARLNRLLGIDADADANASGAAPPLLDRVARLETLLATLEGQLLATASADREAAPNAAPLADEGGAATATTAEQRSLFLPSRGTAGGPLHYGERATPLDLHAFLDLEYTDAGPDGERAGVSTFDNHHANLFLRSQLRPNLLAHVEIELEHSGNQVEIDQAYLAWAPLDYLTVKGGRFYTPFGIERFVWYAPTNALVSRPIAMRQIVPSNFYANGVAFEGIAGKTRRFSYELAISDGLGDDADVDRRGSRQTRDNNASRAVSGRLGFAVGSRFEIGTSFHQQRYDADSDLDLSFFGLDLAARWQGWELRGEWVQAAVEQADASLGDLDQDGWYAQLSYAFLRDRDLVPEVKLVGRYDVIDLDRMLRDGGDQRATALGLNLLLHDHFRFKLEYQRIDEDGPHRDDDTFRLQLALDF